VVRKIRLPQSCTPGLCLHSLPLSADKDAIYDKIKEFEREYLEFLNVSHRDILDELKAGKLTDEITATLEKVAKDLSEKYAK